MALVFSRTGVLAHDVSFQVSNAMRLAALREALGVR
jgi:hypothetical protein